MQGQTRRLRVSLADLEMAFDDASWENEHYLDLETGRVVSIFRDNIGLALGEVYEEMQRDKEHPLDFEQALQRCDLQDWMQVAVREAYEVEVGYGTRYIRLPEADSHEGYREMEDFIVTVRNQSLQNRLWRAIEGRGAFRYFKNVLAEDRREQERWFTFQADRLRQRVLDWFESEGIEAIIEEPAPLPPPPVRSRLIAEMLTFVHAASRLPGVLRIAMIGSLTTDEPDPKDADMLVTVTDEMNLEPLATLGRKLAGHAQQFNRGGEVFLADPRGNYLGRTCPWRRCAPGIRMSCDALHCGRRPYLHDDLKSITLPKQLIAAPPIELWPHVVTRVAAPDDVDQGLLALLRAESGA